MGAMEKMLNGATLRVVMAPLVTTTVIMTNHTVKLKVGDTKQNLHHAVEEGPEVEHGVEEEEDSKIENFSLINGKQLYKTSF